MRIAQFFTLLLLLPIACAFSGELEPLIVNQFAKSQGYAIRRVQNDPQLTPTEKNQLISAVLQLKPKAISPGAHSTKILTAGRTILPMIPNAHPQVEIFPERFKLFSQSNGADFLISSARTAIQLMALKKQGIATSEGIIGNGGDDLAIRFTREITGIRELLLPELIVNTSSQEMTLLLKHPLFERVAADQILDYLLRVTPIVSMLKLSWVGQARSPGNGPLTALERGAWAALIDKKALSSLGPERYSRDQPWIGCLNVFKYPEDLIVIQDPKHPKNYIGKVPGYENEITYEWMPLPLLVKIDLEQWFKRDSASGIAEIFSIAEKLSTQLRVHPAAPMVTYVCNTKEVTPLVWKPTDRQRTFLIEWLVRKNLERLRESEKISLWRENPSPSDLTPNKNDQRSTEQLRLEAECLVWIQKIENLAKKKRQASTMSSERSDASSESENFSPLRFRSPFEKLEGRTIQIKWSEFPLFLAGNAERKTAINYWTTEGLPEILVDQTRWNQSPKTQRQLLIHELYGLAGVDDSDYVASEDISVRWNESLKPSEQNYLGYLLQLVGLPKDTKFPACSNIQEHY